MSNYKNDKWVRKRNEIVRNAHEAFPESEAPVCKRFGCGKVLTPTEYMYGEYCFACARTKRLTDINKPDNDQGNEAQP